MIGTLMSVMGDVIGAIETEAEKLDAAITWMTLVLSGIAANRPIIVRCSNCQKPRCIRPLLMKRVPNPYGVTYWHRKCLHRYREQQLALHQRKSEAQRRRREEDDRPRWRA